VHERKCPQGEERGDIALVDQQGGVMPGEQVDMTGPGSFDH